MKTLWYYTQCWYFMVFVNLCCFRFCLWTICWCLQSFVQEPFISLSLCNQDWDRGPERTLTCVGKIPQLPVLPYRAKLMSLRENCLIVTTQHQVLTFYSPSLFLSTDLNERRNITFCFNEMLVISMSVSRYQISRSMFCKSLMCLEDSIKVVTQQISVLLNLKSRV